MYQCCHCTPDCTKIPFWGVWHLTDIPLYNGKGLRTFLAFEDGLRCRFRHYNHPFKGWKLVLETVYFEGWCTSKQVEKVLKVKLKFRGSKSGHPTDDLLWSSGRPTAILGVMTPGRPLNLHAAGKIQWGYTVARTSWFVRSLRQSHLHEQRIDQTGVPQWRCLFYPI